jgi:hypothetical protein
MPGFAAGPGQSAGHGGFGGAQAQAAPPGYPSAPPGYAPPGGPPGPGGYGRPAQPGQYGREGQPGQFGRPGQPGSAGPLQGQAPMPGGYPPPNSHQGPTGFPGPTNHPGPTGQPGRMGQQGPGGFAGPGPGPRPGPGPSGYPGYGYLGADGYGENVNGGDYAYVINRARADAARPGRPSAPEPTPADDSRPRADPRGQAATDSLRAITAGAAGLTRSADPLADPGEAYGRDDPAYGPPGPDWYNKEQQAANSEQAAAERTAQTARAEAVPAETGQAAAAQAEATQGAATGPLDVNPHVVRGPFEPLVETLAHTSDLDAAEADHGREGTRARSWGDGGDVTGGTGWTSADVDRDTGPDGVSGYEPISEEFPGLADDDPAGSADAALDRLKALHLTAEAVAPQTLDAHFDQLLERQRKLISEYLSQSGVPGTRAATSTSTDDGSLVSYGDDHWSTR